MQKTSHQTYHFEDFTLDLTRGRLLQGSTLVKLRPKSFFLLCYLVEHNNRLLSTEELMNAVWPDTAVTPDSLAQCVKNVRDALGDKAQTIIKSEPGRGYIFDREVKEGETATLPTTYKDETTGVRLVIEEEESNGHEGSSTDITTKALPPWQSRTQRLTGAIKRHKVATGVAVAALVLVVVAGIVFAKPILTWWFKPPTIAVLPFINGTGDPSLDSAGDGLTEGIIQSLSQINVPSKLPKLLVSPLFSVTTFKGRAIDPRQAGREMGVDFVLAGRITDNQKVLTTKAELIKVSDGSRVWGAQNSEFGLLSMELPEKIAQDVVQTLRLKLSDDERRRLTKRDTQNSAAYAAYIKGNVLFRGSPASLKKSEAYYQQAINLDPNFAMPYSMMGGIRQLLAVYGMTPPRESYQEANAWWAKALQRDDSLTVVQVQVQAQKFWFDWDWEGIEKAGKRTGVYFDYLAAMGRFDESLAAFKQGQAWLPTSSAATTSVGFDLYFMRRYDEAIEQFKKAISLDSDNWAAHFFLGFTYSHKGMHEEAIAEMQKSIELQEDASPSVAGLGYVYAVAGRRDEAIKILNQLQERSDRGEYVWPLGIALIHLGLGEKDEAFTWLDKAYDDHSTGMNYLKVNPVYDPLRSDPRFTSLLRRMRFPS